VELLGVSTCRSLTEYLLQIWIHTIDSRLVPTLILRIISLVVRIDLRNSTCVARTSTTLVTLLVARVPLPREVE
jgi:hypothetical protein